MGSFLAQLTKGFIRSAVNQVGRDGGKVISNRIYGDKHSTPIRNVSINNGEYIDSNSNNPLTISELRERTMLDGYQISCSISDMGILLKIWGFILGVIVSALLCYIHVIFSVIPSIIFIIFAGLKYKSRYIVKAYKYEEIPVYTTDKRYKSQKRIKEYVKQKVSYNIPATSEEQKKIQIISFLYIILAIIMGILGVFVYKFIDI